MSIDGLVAAYRIDTGEEVRIPPHWLDDPTLSKPFTTIPPTGTSDTPDSDPDPTDPDPTPGPDLDTTTTRTSRFGRSSTVQSDTETPAAGAKE